MKRNVTVEIGGQKLRLSTDADEEHVARLAALVNERIADVQGSGRPNPSLMALVALSLADDLLAAESRRRSLEEATRRAVSSAIERIDRRLAESARSARDTAGARLDAASPASDEPSPELEP